MTAKKFYNAVANGKTELPGLLLELLEKSGAGYCIVGGLAVNAYAEPVVSLDLDIVLAAQSIEPLCQSAAAAGFRVERFANSINLGMKGSDLRIQIQTDPRYQDFIGRAETRTVLGYALRVASIRDVLQGKLWAYGDRSRRPSKRQKDLADILRLVETHPELRSELPAGLILPD